MNPPAVISYGRFPIAKAEADVEGRSYSQHGFLTEKADFQVDS